jgi:hypothetical protein
MTMNNDKLEEKFQKIEQNLPDKPWSFSNLEAVVNKWLLIQDKGLLKVVIGAVIANKLDTDPVWLFIVAPPGGSKTELIRGLNKIGGIYPLSDLTPQTFLSGERGKNSSLLLRLDPNTLLTLKDFTTVLTMHRDNRHAILSQLREIYDGYYSKAFGTGETKTWEGKMGFIAGVTSIIDTHQSVFQVLGERFVQYRPSQPDTVILAKKAMKNSGQEKVMRQEIQDACAGFVASLPIPDDLSDISGELEDHIANLAALVTRARSGVIREGYSSRDIEFIPDPELPTRLAKQLVTFYCAFRLIGNAAPVEDYALVFKVAMDGLPQKRRKVLELLFDSGTLDTTEVATSINYPTNTVRRTLEDLHGLGLVDRESKGKGYADQWQISAHARGLFAKAKPPGLDASGLPDVSEDTIKQIDAVLGVEEFQAAPDVSEVPKIKPKQERLI